MRIGLDSRLRGNDREEKNGIKKARLISHRAKAG
jgi:hypothetical protein